MAADVYRSTVGDYVTLVRGTTYKGELVGEPGPALLGLGSIEPGGGFRIDKYKTYGGDCPGELMLFPGDLYASLKGATKDGKMIGSVARVPLTVSRGRLTQDTVKLAFRNPNPEDATYLYWVLRTPQYREYCAGHAMGSAVVALSRRDFLSYAVPPLTPERRKVVALLDEIEEKIDVSRRMSETLEAMARALFKSWFVDFDPVRAKVEGRDPGLPQPLADLFPARLVESELGEIPEGWVARRLGECVDTLSGGTPSKGEVALWNGDVPWISPKVMTAIHADEADAYVDESAIGNGTRLAPTLSTLVMVRGMGLHEFVRVSQTRREVTFNQDVKALVGRLIEPTLLLFALLDAQPLLLDRVESAGHGTGKLPTEVLLALPIAMPDSVTQQRLAARLRALNDRIGSTRAESRTLVALRDTLLPKLISGELRVKNAERLVQGVT
jgi:type I restriction enzyme S subunit